MECWAMKSIDEEGEALSVAALTPAQRAAVYLPKTAPASCHRGCTGLVWLLEALLTFTSGHKELTHHWNGIIRISGSSNTCLNSMTMPQITWLCFMNASPSGLRVQLGAQCLSEKFWGNKRHKGPPQTYFSSHSEPTLVIRHPKVTAILHTLEISL